MNKKEAYADKMKAQLDEWKAELDKLEAKAKKAGADTRIKYADQITILREKRLNLKHKLEVIQDIGEDEWGEFKGDMEEIGEYLRKEVKELRSKIDQM